MLKKMIKIFVLTMLMTCLFGTSVCAKDKRCGYNGCNASIEDCDNGTVYCDRHAASYAMKSGYDECGVSGCYARALSSSGYCSGHTCHANKYCTNKATTKGGKCDLHSKEDPNAKCKYISTTRDNFSSSKKKSSSSSTTKKYTSSSSTKKNSSSSTTKKNTYSTKKQSTNKKKYEMPDCDDYDSYDDFMDDWDGCMPDGSDAEDYWENW